MNGFHLKGFALGGRTARAALDMSGAEERLARAYVRLHQMAAEDMLPYMPARTGAFRARTQAANEAMAGSGHIYAGVGPMGRYLYRGRAMADAATGRGPALIPGVGPRFEKGARLAVTGRALRYSAAGAGPAWFEAAKAQHIDRWTREVQRIINGG